MKKFKLIIILCLTILATGCFGSISMDEIEIETTAYPIEYITERIYGEHSTISSIYPNDMDADYIVSDKLLNDYSKTDLFIFNGNETNENEYMKKMVKKNNNLKIINATESLPYTYAIEELWLDPLNLLTIANNVKKGFHEYTTTAYLINDIDNNYEKLKNELIQLDADYREMANRANNKTIIVGDDLFLYLKKYGIDVVSLDDSEELTQKVLHDAEELVSGGTVKTIYIPKGTKANSNVQALKDKYNITIVELDTLYTLTEQDRKDNKTYFTIMYNNLELLKEQLYK